VVVTVTSTVKSGDSLLPPHIQSYTYDNETLRSVGMGGNGVPTTRQ